MDGTLTVPVIDFAKMRRVVGVPQGQDILDFLASLPPEERAVREMALHAVEEEGMAAMQVQPGADELAAHLDERGVPRCEGGGGCPGMAARGTAARGMDARGMAARGTAVGSRLVW